MSGSRRRLAALAVTVSMVLSLFVAPSGAAVVSSGNVSTGTAPNVDIADATITAGNDSPLEVAYNFEGTGLAASDLQVLVEDPDGNVVGFLSPLPQLKGTSTYTIGASQVSHDVTLSATVVDTNNGQTVASDPAAITVSGATVSAAGNAGSTVLDVGETVTVDGSGSTASDGVDEYHWNYTGDRQSDQQGATITHSFASAGVYDVTLTTYNDEQSADNGIITDRDSFRVYVGDDRKPDSALQVYPYTASTGETVQFYAGGSSDNFGITTYEWDYDGDGTYDATTRAGSMPGPLTTHTYSSTGTYDAAVRVSDGSGNTNVSTMEVTVAPEPTVTHSSVEHTGNGTAPGGSIASKTVTAGGMFQFYLHPDGQPSVRSLGGVGADESTELWVNFTMTNYSPDMAMGAAAVDSWRTYPNANGAGTNVSLKLHPIEMQRLTTFTGVSPSQWPAGDNQADMAITPGANLGMYDVPDGSKMETNFSGAMLTSDAQAFVPPRFDQQSGTLSYSVAAPHFEADLVDGKKVQNTGFYRAEIPAGLVTWMGIENPSALVGSYTSNGKQSALSNMQVTETDAGGIEINVTGIHYSSGTLNFQKDTTAPTADAGSDDSVTQGNSITLDGSASSDDGTISSYEWDTDGDGTADLTGVSPSTSFSSTGEHTVRLTVTDGADNTASDTVTISVNEASSSSDGTSTTSVTSTTTPTTTPTATPTSTAVQTPTPTPAPTDGSTTDTPTVTDAATPTPAADGGFEDAVRTTASNGPGFGSVAAVLAVMVALTLLARRD